MIKKAKKSRWESSSLDQILGKTLKKQYLSARLVKGTVSKITAYGAFVELDNGLEGLIHVTELSDEAFGKVEDIVDVGSEVTAKVIKLDPEHKKISLSIKEHLIDETQSNRDDVVVGKEPTTTQNNSSAKE